ncbi:MAG: hypothetical protein NC833_02960 [Candidatus Omnitrophica bacterium]|nr:hypothetical protein [Candidatus Omnitrophota bacterium]
MFEIKIIRSPFGDFYNREIEDCNKSYPDWYLKEINQQNFNGIWLHSILRDIIKSNIFPEFGKKEKEQIYQLNKLVERCDKFGIKVFLYLCEPRGFKEDDPFWIKNFDVKGQICDFGKLWGRHYALCSSTEKVKNFLYESSYNLFKKVKGLGGAFLITASEFHTHCYSHFPKHIHLVKHFREMVDWTKLGFYCKRCEKRQPYEVVCEIIKLIRDGIKDANSKAEIIAWDWSWSIIEPEPQENLIKNLPKDVILMSDFERGGYKFFNNKRYIIDEYSLSYIGPSPRFKRHFYIAKKYGHKVMAKLQFSTTHEFVTVPYIPVIFNVAEKIEKLKKIGGDGFLYCWIFGGGINVVSKLTGIMSNENISKYKAIKRVVKEEFGEKTSDYVVKAWENFSESFKNYPFSIPFIYNGPINYAVVYPFNINAEKVDLISSWLPLPRDKKGYLKVGDNLETWIGELKPKFYISQLKKTAREWKKGIEILEKGIKIEENERLQKEIDIARHIYFSFKSTSNIIEFYLSLRNYKKNKGKKWVKKILKILKEELEITEKDKKIWMRNKEFGYHPEAFENFIKEKDFNYKIGILKNQIEILKKLNRRNNF